MTNNEEDRKKVFWMLKKYSSYTAWKALGDTFQQFADAWEYAVKKSKPPLASDDFWVEALKEFWDGCSGFDKGLPLLKQGDRFIFTEKGNWIISNEIEYARRLMDTDEYEHDWMINKDAVFAAHNTVEKYKNFFWISENDLAPDFRIP